MKDMTCVQARAILFKGSLARRMRSGLTLIAPEMDLVANCADQRRLGAMLASKVADDSHWTYPRVRGQL